MLYVFYASLYFLFDHTIKIVPFFQVGCLCSFLLAFRGLILFGFQGGGCRILTGISISFIQHQSDTLFARAKSWPFQIRLVNLYNCLIEKEIEGNSIAQYFGFVILYIYIHYKYTREILVNTVFNSQ